MSKATKAVTAISYTKSQLELISDLKCPNCNSSLEFSMAVELGITIRSDNLTKHGASDTVDIHLDTPCTCSICHYTSTLAVFKPNLKANSEDSLYTRFKNLSPVRQREFKAAAKAIAREEAKTKINTRTSDLKEFMAIIDALGVTWVKAFVEYYTYYSR